MVTYFVARADRGRPNGISDHELASVGSKRCHYEGDVERIDLKDGAPHVKDFNHRIRKKEHQESSESLPSCLPIAQRCCAFIPSQGVGTNEEIHAMRCHQIVARLSQDRHGKADK